MYYKILEKLFYNLKYILDLNKISQKWETKPQRKMSNLKKI